MKKTLIVATRGGALATAQAEIVVSALNPLFPAIDIQIKKIASEGDRDRRTTLWELRETGFFTSKLEEALLANEADLAVHSFKDLPIAIREGLTIAAVFDRKFPEDCLISASLIKTLDELPKNAKIGTSSLRRAVQLKRLRGDLQCVPIRGNVPTRLKKLEKGDSLRDKFDAIVLARAGLERLGLGDKASTVFDPTQFIPAPAQGALAVQVRDDDNQTKEIVSKLADEEARITTTAERLVFSALGCGCHAPAGVFARLSGDKITIYGCFSKSDGRDFRQFDVSGPVTSYEALAQTLADKLLKYI
jgi:hydroxymethylbilane synthase